MASARARRLQLRGQPRIWNRLRTAFPVRSLKERTVERGQLRRVASPLSNAIRRRLAPDGRAAIVLGVVGSRVVRDKKGNAVWDRPNASAAPAPVRGELPSTCHWGFAPGRPRRSKDPRARRPAGGVNASPRPRVEGEKGDPMNSLPTETAGAVPQAVAVPTASRAVSIFAAALLGLFIVGGIGFSHIMAVHNATHDYRHSMGFPCH